jgi:hypothetical protein
MKDKSKLLELFEALYKDSKNNVMLMKKFIEGYTVLKNNLHHLYDACNIPHDDDAMRQFALILDAAQQKVEITQHLIYYVEHPDTPINPAIIEAVVLNKESEGKDEY